MCLQRHNPINLIKMEAYKKIEEAKKLLKDNGYYVDNLWHINDVIDNANDDLEIDDDTAYEVLDRAMQSEWLVSKTFEVLNDETNEIINEIKNED